MVFIIEMGFYSFFFFLLNSNQNLSFKITSLDLNHLVMVKLLFSSFLCNTKTSIWMWFCLGSFTVRNQKYEGKERRQKCLASGVLKGYCDQTSF